MTLKAKKAVSLTIDRENIEFLKNFATQNHRSNSAMANDIFKIFRKQIIAHYFSQDAKADNQKDVDFVNMDWSDYESIVKEK